MKKIICIFTACMCLFSVNAGAMNFTQMTEKLMQYYKIETGEDLSGIKRLQNRRNLKNPALISTAINNGIIAARNGIVIENGTDFAPLTDGIIKKYINDDNFRFTAGNKVELLRNQNVKLNDKTFFVTENSAEEDLNYTDMYTCIVDRENNVLFLWESGDVALPVLYRVKLYWVENDEMIVTEMYRKEYDLWLKESKNQFYTMDCSQVGITKEFILENLDKYIYVFCDGNEDKLVVKGVSK